MFQVTPGQIWVSIYSSTNPTPNYITTEYFLNLLTHLRLQDAKKLDCTFWFPEYIPVKADSRNKPEYSYVRNFPTSFRGIPLLAEEDWGPEQDLCLPESPEQAGLSP